MIERRKFKRIPSSTEITYKQLQKTKSAKFLTKNISKTGARFYVHESLAVGSFIWVKIKLLKTFFIFEAIGIIRWLEKSNSENRYEIGVEFVDISEETQQQIEHYINQESL